MNRVFSNFKYYLISIFLLIILGVSSILATNNLSLSSTTIDDNIISGATVATITADSASGSVSYSIACTVPGADDSKFSIGGAGSDELIIGENPDYFTQSSYDVCIRATDDDGTYDENFTLTVIDKTLPEFSSITVSSSNANPLYAKASDTIIFSLDLLLSDSSGNGNSVGFDLLSSTGHVVNFDQNPLALSQHNGVFTVQPGQSGTIDITSLVFADNNTNSLSGFSLPYILPSNIIIDTTIPSVDIIDNVSNSSNLTDDINIVVTDDNLDASSLMYGFSDDATCDITDNYDVSFTSGNTFTISDTLNNGKYLCIKAEDFAGNVTHMISTYPLNIATVGIELSGTGINENSLSGTTIGDFSTLYSTGTTFTYEFATGTGDNDNSSFIITTTGSTYSLVTQFDANYEAKNSYNVRIKSTDENSIVVENEFTIYINDVNEQPTDITLSSGSIDENMGVGLIVGDFTTTDEDTGETHTYSFVGGTGSDDNGSFTLSGSSLVTAFDGDHEVKNSYSVLVRSTDNGGLTTDKQFTIAVNNISESPTDISLSGNTLTENVSSGTLVGELSSIDQDVGDTFTYTLVVGTGSDDNTNFSITGTGLYIEEVPNFEAKAAYSILVRSTDSFGKTYDEQFTITIINENETPIDVTLSGSTIDENVGVGTFVGELTTTDQDVGDTFSYSLVGGLGSNDNSVFTLSGTSIIANFTPDYEVNNSYSIRVQTQDNGGLSFENIIIITVNDLNESPTDISISANNIDENLGVSAPVGLFGTIDQDTTDTHTYTLIAGTGSDDNSSFSISGSTLVAEFNGDYETKDTYTILVRSTDSLGLTVDKQFNITINNVNLAPTDLTLSGSTIQENMVSGTTIGELIGTDDGENNGSLTYSFACSTGGVDDTSFLITGSTLLSNGIYNYETKDTYNICVKVSDGMLSFDKDFIITVDDINENPTDIAITANNIDENLGAGAIVGTLSTIDQDTIDTHTYTLISGTGSDDNGDFSISGDTLIADFNGDFETKSTYSVLVRSTDLGGLNTDKQFTITINNLNLAPTDLTLSGNTIPENSSIGTIIGELTGIDDGENNGSLTYSFTCSTPGADDISFTITGSTLQSNGTYNFESKDTYNICVRVSDGILSYDKDFTIGVTDINENPTDIAITADNIDENQGTGTTVGTFASIDQDTGDTHTYTLVAGTGSDDNSSFSITGTTLIAEFDADFETRSTYSILVRSTDLEGLTTDKQFTITINDLNLAPTDLTLSGTTILENTFVGTVVGTLIGTDDSEDNGNLVYSFTCSTGGIDDSKFTIVGTDLKTATPINFESGSTLNICVNVSDGVLSMDKNFVINLGNVNESPYDFIFTQNSFDENVGTGFLVGNLSSLDEDAGDLHTYDFETGIGSTDNSSFTLSGSQVISSFDPNYENKNLYQVKFKVTDSGGITTDLQNTIIVNNVNEAPSDIALSNSFVDENIGTGALVGLFDSTDEDLGDSHNYSLVAGIGSADNSSFTIVGNALITDVVGDYETKSTYTIRLRSTDSGGLFTEKQFTIYLNDVDETGVVVTLSGSTLSENMGTGTTVGSLSTTSSNTGSTSFTYTLVAGTGSDDNSSFSISGTDLIADFDADFETKNTYSILVRSIDNLSNIKDTIFTINILNVNEQATDINLSSSTIDENTSGINIVGTFTTTDEDQTDTYNYTLVGGIGSNDNSLFTIVGNTLLSGFIPDYETKNLYYIRVRSTDNGLLVTEKEFTITINDLLENPTDISFSGSLALDENTASGLTLGNFNTAGTNSGVTYTYTLSGTGGDNGSFTIAGDNLVTNFVPDYETQNIYNILVRSTDSLGYFFEESFTVTINNINETPSDIALSSNTIVENSLVGTTVGDLTTSATDFGDTYTYTFVSGTGSDDNASFTISGSTIITAFVADYETQNSYNIRIRSTDTGANFTEKEFNITVSNLNIAPSDISLSANNIDENSPIGTTIGSFTGSDDGEDNGTLTYSFTCATPGTDDNSFSITGTTLLSNAVFNYESNNTYNICVRLSDGSLSYDENFVINVNNLVENPTDIIFSGSLNLAESIASGYTMGSFDSVGVNTGVTYTYTLVSGTGSDDNASFTIIGDNLVTAFSTDYETQNIYSIRVRTTDSLSATLEEQFTITINNENTAPTDITLSGSTIDENLPLGTIIGSFTGTDDGENNGTLDYSLACATGGLDDSSFTLSGTTLLSNGVFNYEVKNTYNICARVSDGSLTYDEDFIITVNNTNEGPTDITLSSNTLNEGILTGATVGTLSTTDQDGGVHTYTFVTGTGSDDNNSFTITGDILTTNFSVDYETKNSYTIRVRSTDDGLNFTEKEFTITVNNTNNAPTDLSLSGSIIDENLSIGTLVGTLTGTDDGEDNGTLTFSLACATGGVDDNNFTISGVNLLSNRIFDYETQSTHNICVRVSDGAYSFDKDLVISINDIIEAPTDIAFSGSLTINEFTASGTSLGDFSTTGTNSGVTYTYTLVAGTGSDDNTSFTISGSSLVTNFVADYETQNTYSILVRSTDSLGSSVEKQFNVTIINLNNGPSDVTLSSNTINENVAVGTTIGTLVGVDDGEDNNTLTYSLSCTTPGVDDASFSIAGAILSNNTIFDYESKNTYNICVRVSDGTQNFDKDFVIAVNDISETGTDITFSGSLALNENTTTGFNLGDFETVGTNTGVTYTYTLVAGTGSDDNISFTVSGSSLSTAFVPNYETKNTYSLRIRSTDSLGAIIEKQFSVIINDVNENPTDMSISSSSINENLGAGAIVGAFTTIDVDTSNTFTYTLVAGTGSDNNGSFGISGGNLVANFSADYETKNSYTVRVRSTDNGGLFTEKQFVVSINNLSEGSSGGGGGGGGSGAGSVKDNCPSGDYSPSYYDRTCGTKPKTGTGTTTSTGSTSTGTTSTSTGTSSTGSIDSILDKTFEDITYEDDKGNEYTIQKTKTGKYVLKKEDGTYENRVFPTVEKTKEYADILGEQVKVVLDDYDFDESFKPVVYVSRYGDRFISRKLTNGRYLLYSENGMKLNGLFSKQYEIIQYLQRVFGKNAFLPSKHTS